MKHYLSLLIFTAVLGFTAQASEITIEFKPEAQIMFETPDSPVTVILQEIADVKVDAPLADTMALSLNSVFDSFRFTKAYAELPKGWNGDSPIALTLTLKADAPKADFIYCAYIAAFEITCKGTPFNKTKTTRNPSGRSVMLYNKASEKNRSALGIYDTPSPDGIGYIPRLPLGGWMDSAFAAASLSDNVRASALTIYVGNNEDGYQYNNGSGSRSGLVTGDLIGSSFAKFMNFRHLPVQFLVHRETEVPFSQFGTEFNFADSVVLWFENPPTEDIYFDMIGLIPGSHPHYMFTNGMLREEGARLHLMGKIPAGWRMGDSLMVTGIYNEEPKIEARSGRIHSFRLYRDPEMTQPYLPQDDASGTAIRHQLFESFNAEEEVTCPVIYLTEPHVLFNASDSLATQSIAIRLSQSLDAPLEVGFEINNNDAGTYSVLENPLMIPAGVDSAMITIQKSGVLPKRGLASSLKLKIDPKEISRVRIREKTGTYLHAAN